MVIEDRPEEGQSNQAEHERTDNLKGLFRGHVLLKTIFLDSPDTTTPLSCPPKLVMLLLGSIWGMLLLIQSLHCMVTIYLKVYFSLNSVPGAQKLCMLAALVPNSAQELKNVR